MCSDRFTTGWATWSGTSFAAAIVTGRIAEAMSKGRTAREAADEVLPDDGPKITVHDVNGPREVAYVARKA
jgi:hypothetical protein